MNFVDLHLHGAFGVDVVTATPVELDRLAEGLAARGYASFLPTLVPLSLDELEPVVARLGAWIEGRADEDGRGAVPLGLHFEGPFVNPARAGALHPDRFLTGRDERGVERFFRLADSVPGATMITLAPEIDGGLEVVRAARTRGWLVSMGHTDATTRDLDAAVEAGASHLTHFCNAMRPFHHREPGPIGYGLVHDEVSLDLIADLHHLHPDVLRLAVERKPPGSLAVISDAIPPAGLADGAFTIWDEVIEVRDGEARNAHGSLAGSVVLLDEAVRNLAAIAGHERALAAASDVPLRLIRAAARA